MTDVSPADVLVVAPLINDEGRKVGWVMTRIGAITVEQREYVRRLRWQERSRKASEKRSDSRPKSGPAPERGQPRRVNVDAVLAGRAIRAAFSSKPKEGKS